MTLSLTTINNECQKEVRGRKHQKSVFEDLVAEHLPNLLKNINLQI
jgi:hypothetical protein